MGLDMYLSCTSRPLSMYICRKAISDAIEIEDEGYRELCIDLAESSASRGQVAYWRKANAIHRWFVENIQYGKDDCGIYEATVGDLENLLDVVKRVLADHSLAEELLPTQSGFFFGGTNYDEYYWEDLEDTKRQLECILNNLNIEVGKYGIRYAAHPDEPDWHVRFFYRASW